MSCIDVDKREEEVEVDFGGVSCGRGEDVERGWEEEEGVRPI
jgi:hypothetical protein